MNKQIWKRIWSGWITFNYVVIVHFSLILVLLIAAYFLITLFQNLKKDTTAITNTAFAIVASLAALFFSCAKAIEENSKEKDRFAYAGERLMHAGILLLTASILKYGALSLQSVGQISANTELASGISYIFGIIGGVLFFQAVTTSHTGLRILNSLLWSRISRYPDWDNIF